MRARSRKLVVRRFARTGLRTTREAQFLMSFGHAQTMGSLSTWANGSRESHLGCRRLHHCGSLDYRRGMKLEDLRT